MIINPSYRLLYYGLLVAVTSAAVFWGVVFFPIFSLYLMNFLHIVPSFELQVVLSYLAVFAIIAVHTYLSITYICE